MVSDSPADALGPQAAAVRDRMIEVVRSVHERFADAHVVSGSRYALGFGSQWRDLLDSAHDEVTKLGFQSHRLNPGGHKLPVVNGCLVYVWRVPDNPNAVSRFAASPTRQSGFAAPLPPAMLFEPAIIEEAEPVEGLDAAGTATMLDAVQEAMPLVLVMVWSTPRRLQSVEWAVAVLDDDGKVTLRGQECIWEPEPELVAAGAAPEVESFDSGTPVRPVVELQEQKGTDADAR